MSSKYYDPKKAHERYMENRERILARMKAKRDAMSPEEKEKERKASREYQAAYREANPERWKAARARYLAKKRASLSLLFLTLSFSINAQTIVQVESELQRQQVPQAKIVLAQARLETGNFTSQRCKRDHNLFGIKHNGRYAKYKSWQASIADYKKCISNRYNGGDYYAFLKRIGYASDSRYTQKLKNIVKTSK